MRLRRLSLDRFGHFTDRQFDFGAAGDGPDFHIIHGPNEAGKTTTMEAALRLFYGFPQRDGYAFRHQRANLQVSAELEIDGQIRQFTRLPKRGASLLDASGTALPETALAAHLAGLSEDDYRKLLCLDDETIERGGDEIAQARGDIGRLLFSAAAGVADLSTVLDSVRQDADAIWRKRASKTRMAELKRDLAEVEKQIRDRDTSASAWRGLKKALADARTSEAQARDARDALHDAAAQIAARRRALPLLAEIDNLTQAIAAFADYPARLDFDPETLVALLAEDSRLRADIQRLTDDIADNAVTRDALHRDPDQVALSDRLDALDTLRARDVTASQDLDRRRNSQEQAEAAMARIARDLGASPDIDPRRLVLTQAQLATLDRARQTLRQAEAAEQAAARDLADVTARYEAAKSAHDRQSAQSPAPRGMADLLARHDADRLATAHATAQAAIASALRLATAGRAALAVGAVQFDALPDCPTSTIAAQDWADTHTDTLDRIARMQDTLAQHRADTAALTAQADEMLTAVPIASDAEEQALRATRDRLWHAHRSSLSDASAQEFQTAMQALDDAMDNRLSHADTLAQLRQVQQARAQSQARAEQAETRLAELHEVRTDIETQANAAAASVGLPPHTPAEWRDWVQRHATAAQAARDLAQARDSHQATLDRAARLLDRLRPLVPLDAPDFDAALTAARKLAEAETAAQTATAAVRGTLAALDTDLKDRTARHKTALQQAQQAEQAWRDLVTELLGDAIAPDTLLVSLDPLRGLREQDAQRAEAAQRVQTMQADQAQFAGEIAAIAAAQGVTPAETPAGTFALLRAQSQAAQLAEAQAQELTTAIDAAQAALTGTRRRLDDIAGQVAVMGRIFPAATPVGTLDALRRATTQAQQVITDRTELARHERQLLTELDAPDLGTARAVLDGLTLATLDAQAQAVKSDLAAAERALTQATEARVTAETALAQVTGDSDMAALTEQKATLELELQEAAQDHLHLSLGHMLADEAIRRYRDTHRSGMMAATERCFATLTNGAYARLITQPDGTDETLLAVDADGTAKRVAEMSKGTRFQLYLALRAAAHEQLVAQGTCLPFFCDDIFETFDEDRTSAACRVLERIGRSGQAIYLTHHRHVVEIAQSVCDTAPTIHLI